MQTGAEQEPAEIIDIRVVGTQCGSFVVTDLNPLTRQPVTGQGRTAIGSFCGLIFEGASQQQHRGMTGV